MAQLLVAAAPVAPTDITASARSGSSTKHCQQGLCALTVATGWCGSTGEHWRAESATGQSRHKLEFTTLAEGEYSPSKVDIQTRDSGSLGPCTRISIANADRSGRRVTLFEGSAEAVRFSIRATEGGGAIVKSAS